MYIYIYIYIVNCYQLQLAIAESARLKEPILQFASLRVLNKMEQYSELLSIATSNCWECSTKGAGKSSDEAACPSEPWVKLFIFVWKLHIYIYIYIYTFLSLLEQDPKFHLNSISFKKFFIPHSGLEPWTAGVLSETPTSLPSWDGKGKVLARCSYTASRVICNIYVCLFMK